MTNSQLISQLRQALCFTEEQASDEEILHMTEGTLLRARCELGIAVSEMRAAILRQFEPLFAPLYVSIEKAMGWEGREEATGWVESEEPPTQEEANEIFTNAVLNHLTTDGPFEVAE